MKPEKNKKNIKYLRKRKTKIMAGTRCHGHRPVEDPEPSKKPGTVRPITNDNSELPSTKYPKENNVFGNDVKRLLVSAVTLAIKWIGHTVLK